MKRVVLLVSFVSLAMATGVCAQEKPPVNTSVLCTRDNVADITKQQILLTRTFDNPVQRITVLLRAADLLWPHERDRSLAAFMEAFDLAVQNFKEHGDQIRRTSQSQFAAVIPLPDQRFKVISALAKLDSVKAQKLSAQILQEEARDAADQPATKDESKAKAAEKLLGVAKLLASTDAASAVSFARNSLRYPATLFLATFFYELAKTNKAAADQFYFEALGTYSAAPMDQFLYLSAYPFGNTRDAGDMPSHTFYRVPEGYEANRELQRQFMRMLLVRAERAMAMAVESSPNLRLSDQAQMWLALSRLEKQVQDNLPELAEAAARSKNRLFSLLNPTSQQRVSGEIESDNAPKSTFDQQVERAQKLTDVGRRDQLLVSAIIGPASREEPIDKVLSVIDKISDSDVRASLLNWFYYFRAQSLTAEKNLAEARRFAGKVTELDQRAYLFTRIAEESLKVAEDQSEARELLNEISQAVSKAPKTVVTARALLALAYLYAKIDVNRGIEELGNAVKTINALESPDFSQQFVMMKIEGKTFGSYAAFSTPGFNPENAFREIGKIDFDGSLVQATNFTDKSLRALTTLAVIEPCFANKSR
jgi:hypothetical protein